MSLLDLHKCAVEEKLIEQATRGDVAAQRLVFDLTRRDRAITLEIPHIKTAEDALAAHEFVISAVLDGRLTPTEGGNISALISLQIKLLEAVDHEKRISALENEHCHE
jgi:hypothetical protein